MSTSLETGAGLIFVIMGVLALASFAFWIWMLVDCIEKETDQGSTRLLWGIVIAVTHFVGAALYFFLRKLPRGAQS